MLCLFGNVSSRMLEKRIKQRISTAFSVPGGSCWGSEAVCLSATSAIFSESGAAEQTTATLFGFLVC